MAIAESVLRAGHISNRDRNRLQPLATADNPESLTARQRLLHGLEGKILSNNWHEDHTYPAPKHYQHLWLWDSVFAANINAQRGDTDKAKIEINAVLNGADSETGFVPNMQFRTGRNWRDLESMTFNRPDVGSSYTQPPIVAWGVWETYNTIKNQGNEEEGKEFLKESFDRLEGFYSYFENYRENGDGSKLVGNLFPHETGRDSDPSLRPDVPFVKGKGKVAGLVNSFLDYSSVLALNARLKLRDNYPESGRPKVTDIVDFAKRKIQKKKREGARTDWDPEKVRGTYWINDVMFNVLYVNNLRYMEKISAELGRNDKAAEYSTLANDVEKEVLNKMWNEEDGFFYNLDKNGNQIRVPSVSGLFALNLDGIPETQLEKIVEKLEDPKWFNTPYPFPSVPAHSRYYHPHYKEKRLWKRGEVWINTNQLIGEDGLSRQIKRPDINPALQKRMLSVLRRVVDKTEEMVDGDLLENGTTHEFYGAEDRKGHRIRNFTWTLGGRHMHKSKEVLKQMEAQAA